MAEILKMLPSQARDLLVRAKLEPTCRMQQVGFKVTINRFGADYGPYFGLTEDEVWLQAAADIANRNPTFADMCRKVHEQNKD